MLISSRQATLFYADALIDSCSHSWSFPAGRLVYKCQGGRCDGRWHVQARRRTRTIHPLKVSVCFALWQRHAAEISTGQTHRERIVNTAASHRSRLPPFRMKYCRISPARQVKQAISQVHAQSHGQPVIRAIVGFVGVILALAAAYCANCLIADSEFTDGTAGTRPAQSPIAGLTVFAVFFVAALSVERLLEPIADGWNIDKKNDDAIKKIAEAKASTLKAHIYAK